jgi:CTP:molybdopterin cytidylyltransferase MocA
MSVQVQAFPVRFAETINRFGAARSEHVGAPHDHEHFVLVTLGDRSFVARAHAERVTRRGRQTLVSVHGRLSWVSNRRVQPLEEAAA